MTGHRVSRNATDRFPTMPPTVADPERLYDPKTLGGAVSETTEGVELAVPDKAIEALKVADQRIMADPAHTVRSIAAPVVAAELRAHATSIEATAALVHDTSMLDAIVGDLRERADRLDGLT